MSQTPNAVVNESTVVAAVVSPIVVILLLVLALLITIGAILMVKRRKLKAKHLTRIEADGSQRKGKINKKIKINVYNYIFKGQHIIPSPVGHVIIDISMSTCMYK